MDCAGLGGACVCVQVHVADTSTDKCANTHPTAASVGADINGMAVQDACKQINVRSPQAARTRATAPLSVCSLPLLSLRPLPASQPIKALHCLSTHARIGTALYPHWTLTA